MSKQENIKLSKQIPKKLLIGTRNIFIMMRRIDNNTITGSKNFKDSAVELKALEKEFIHD